MRRIDHIVVHCSGGAQTQSATSIVAYHCKTLGWKAPGYHYIIEKNGTVVAVWPEEKVSNGARGHNSRSVHIAYTGGIDAHGRGTDNRTHEQKESMKRLLRELMAKYPSAKIVGHRDIASKDINGNGIIDPGERVKECPCFDAIPEYASLGKSDPRTKLTLCASMILTAALAGCSGTKNVSASMSSGGETTDSTLTTATHIQQAIASHHASADSTALKFTADSIRTSAGTMVYNPSMTLEVKAPLFHSSMADSSRRIHWERKFSRVAAFNKESETTAVTNPPLPKFRRTLIFIAGLIAGSAVMGAFRRLRQFLWSH